MRLMEKAELGGLDSTSTTIKKWDDFFKMALPNLGYRDSLIENMYPYSKGIPLNNGEYLPVDETTGRRFFQLSWADKLAGVLSKINTGQETGNFNSAELYFGSVLSLVTGSFNAAKNVFPDMTEDEYDTLKSGFEEALPSSHALMDFIHSQNVKALWARFLDDSDVYFSALGGCNANGFSSHLNDAEMQNLKGLHGAGWMNRPVLDSGYDYHNTSPINYIIFNKNLDSVYDKFPSGFLDTAFFDSYMNQSTRVAMKSYSEVYFQDYLVISLNPIDKFMLSTKQAFSSCMSIAKQDDTRGTSSGPAFGLPALFPTDSVFLVFLTPGKHKNMYWEEEEWLKAPEDRDKEKAYKYLKMTCRALTYKCKYNYIQEAVLRTYAKQIPAIADKIEKMNVDGERLLIGRQYAAKGEDYGWEWFIEFALSRAGIATGAGLGDALADLQEALRGNYAQLSESLYREEINKITEGTTTSMSVGRQNRVLQDYEYLRKGRLVDGKCVVTDKYGFIRGIYYDNVTVHYKSDVQRQIERNIYQHDEEYPCDVEYQKPSVQTGSTRCGSYGITRYNPKPGLDMFKMITGKQSYSFLNQNVKICSKCGKILTGSEAGRHLPDGSLICNDCCEKLEIKECPVCHQLYTKEEADEHRVVNFRKVINPKNADVLPELPVCVKQLKEAKWQEGGYQNRDYVRAFCAHCGKQENKTYYSSNPPVLGKVRVDISESDYVDVTVVLCSQCLSKAVMCEKCKRVIFLEDLADACLLLPNRRVICPDCINSIRMKQEKRNIIQSVLSDMSLSDVEPEPSDDVHVTDVIARKIEERGSMVGRKDTLIKDIYKQIQSYRQAHPDAPNPQLKASNPPITENTEVEDGPVVIPF